VGLVAHALEQAAHGALIGRAFLRVLDPEAKATPHDDALIIIDMRRARSSTPPKHDAALPPG
jgi:hypothetical protein